MTTETDHEGEHRHDRHGHEAHPTPEMVVLTELADALIADLGNQSAGRTARTILSGTVMRATVIALAEGSELGEHESPPAATLYVIRGKVTMSAGGRDRTLYPGQLVPIPPMRHSLRAHADSAVLLTVALR